MPATIQKKIDAVDYPAELTLADTENALLNILQDYSEEKAYSDNTQRALLNILDDFSAEKENSDNTQKALLNILDDYRTEKENMESTQRAFLNILEDYSEEKTKAESITNDLIAANIENKELEQFAFVASHDLQEPLRTITNFVGLLAEKFEGNTDADTTEYLKFILVAAGKMQALIRDLLELSRIGNSVVFTIIDLNTLVAAVIADMDLSVKNVDAQITVGPLPVIEGNEMELQRLFQNLVSNAIKFRDKNRPLQIQIAAITKGSEWRFTVADNGIGIEDRFKEKIFVIFQRLHTIEEYPGTGIGLASCKKIVALHGGKLSVDSVLGQGSSFHFTIAKKIK